MNDTLELSIDDHVYRVAYNGGTVPLQIVTDTGSLYWRPWTYRDQIGRASCRERV
jgi:hypothetical protein